MKNHFFNYFSIQDRSYKKKSLKRPCLIFSGKFKKLFLINETRPESYIEKLSIIQALYSRNYSKFFQRGHVYRSSIQINCEDAYTS